MSRSYTIALALLAGALFFSSAALRAEERPIEGDWVEFHGWQPDGRAYAYTLVCLRNKKSGTRRVEKPRLVTLDEKRRAKRRDFDGDLGAYALKHDFVAQPARRERPDANSVRFFLEDGRELWFRLVLGDRLGYAVSLHVDGDSVGVGMGHFDDLYGEFDAFAFPAPDGRSVALVIYGQHPYRVRGEVHFMRLPEGPLPVPAVPAGAPVVD